MKMKRFHWALSALVLGIPIRASAKCGGVNYSWGADALASMHDYVVTMMLYEIFRQNHTHISYLQIKLKVFVNHLYSRIIERESNYNNT